MLTVFTLNCLSTALSTLKTVFIARGFIKPVYILVLLDAMMFVWGMKLVVDGEGVAFLLAFALGKTAGVWLGDVVERKLAYGILDVTIMAKRDKAHNLADRLRAMGYVTNTTKTHGLGGEEKWDVRFFVSRKEYESLLMTLEQEGYKNLSMVVTTVDKATGKINTSQVTKEQSVSH